MKKRYLLLSLLCQLSIAQTNTGPNETTAKYFDPQIKTPGVTDFIKYGQLSSISYTGELKLDIPIIDLEIPNQRNFNISLSHVASGFRPSKRNGLVGQNWFLNVGGAITREVNGIPDEHRGTPQTNGTTNYPANGFLVGVSNKTYAGSSVYSNASGTSYTNLDFERLLYGNSSFSNTDPNNYEGDPDTFSFNFNGISGKFFIGNDGQVRVTSSTNEKISVNISELIIQNVANTTGGIPKFPSRITITDGNGNKYFFGGQTRNLEYTLGYPHGGYPKTVINAWYLYRVEYYTGYVVDYNYRDDSILTTAFANQTTSQHGAYYANPVGGAPDRKDFLMFHEFYNEERTMFQTYGSFGGTGEIGGEGGGTLQFSLQKVAILDNIVGDDFKVSFSYSKQAHKFNTRDNITLPGLNNHLFNNFVDIKLDRVTLMSSYGGEIKTFEFGYDYLGGNHSRMYLGTFREVGKPAHAFEYYPTGVLPQPLTFGIDHWGFWNGRNSLTNPLVPLSTLTAAGDFTYGTGDAAASRNPDFASALKGQLSKVTYPTGGYSTFEYDEHRYAKRLESRSTNNFVPQLYTAAGIAGGVRIKKISDFDGSSTEAFHQKTYTYGLSDAVGMESGILFKWPRYASFWKVSMAKYGFIRSSTIGKNLMDTPNIAYSEVAEQTDGNGSVRTRFTDFVTNPDVDDSHFINSGSQSDYTVPAGLSKNYMGYFLNDVSSQRGKVRWVKQFDQSGALKHEKQLEYNNAPSRFDNYNARIHTTGNFIQFNKIYSFSDYLTKETVKSYFSGGSSVTTVKELAYDPVQNYLVSERTTTPTNDVFETQYAYSLVPSLNLQLVDRKRSFKNGQKLSEEKYQYGNTLTSGTAFKYLPIKILSSKFPNSNPIENGEAVLDPKVTFHRYDAKGNPLDISVESGMRIVYLWNATKTRPFAVIQNASFSEVAGALGITENALLNYNEGNMMNINNLRLNPQFQKAMVTTYQFTYATGQLTVVTDPKGFTHKYHYDLLERLVFITDLHGYDPLFDYGNVIKRIDYNYKH